MTLAQSYCENTFQFSLAIPKVTAVFVNSTLFGTTILRSNATTVFIQTEMQSDGILLSVSYTYMYVGIHIRKSLIKLNDYIYTCVCVIVKIYLN